jgi:hypothetical protein
MNKLGNYHEDERGHYNFSFSDNDGKHVQVSFRAEPNYDLNMVFNEFKNFLIASGHDVDGEIGELAVDGYHEGDGWDIDSDEDSDEEAIQAMKQYQSADGKFSMDHFPSNGWPFGGLTTTDFASLTPNQFPTMAPLTQEQVQSWTLSSMDIQALTSADLSRWTVPSPGTIGGAKVSFPIPGPHGGGGIYK